MGKGPRRVFFVERLFLLCPLLGSSIVLPLINFMIVIAYTTSTFCLSVEAVLGTICPQDAHSG